MHNFAQITPPLVTFLFTPSIEKPLEGFYVACECLNISLWVPYFLLILQKPPTRSSQSASMVSQACGRLKCNEVLSTNETVECPKHQVDLIATQTEHLDAAVANLCLA